MREVVPRILRAASLVAVAVTIPLWIGSLRLDPEDELERQRVLRKARVDLWSRPLTEGRCAISSAIFGAGRARLVRAGKDGTVHFVVLEGSPRKVPMNPLYQGDWLRANFGSAETVTLGTYRSSEMALTRAGQLCPPRLRCLPGRPGCEGGPGATPLELFTGLSASRPPFAWEGARPVPWPDTPARP
ncbi:MAG: hypothetical protein NW223_12255 [Hyphomicrobiaceae bacterium]|nr:hypothetical protein [Hyphomicrobiaceae bacterium]